MFKVPEKYRLTSGPLGSTPEYGNNGAFIFDLNGARIVAIASDQMGWEHVSISLTGRCPTWNEMCAVKAMFWSDDACVVQYHPPKSSYVNNHPYCLHLWRPTEQTLPMPPTFMVGVKIEE